MRRYRKRNPAAPELLGSKGAGGAEQLGRQADDDHDQEDTLPTGFDQCSSRNGRRCRAMHGLSADQFAPSIGTQCREVAMTEMRDHTGYRNPNTIGNEEMIAAKVGQDADGISRAT